MRVILIHISNLIIGIQLQPYEKIRKDMKMEKNTRGPMTKKVKHIKDIMDAPSPFNRRSASVHRA